MLLSELVGKEILVNVCLQNDTSLQPMTLLAVENGGIWVESNTFTQLLLKTLEMPASKAPQFFLPFSSIGIVFVGSEEKTALSEKAFGV